MPTKTPMERQYEKLKEEARDALLFFRVGDFYEMFHEDAEKASEILDIALTFRNKNAENLVKMCGVPVRSAERYIAKLTAAGLKVAIAEQVSDPALPGIVERKIVSIVTPGTTLSDHILEEGRSRFIGALFTEKDVFCLVLCEVSTGHVCIVKDSSFEEILQSIYAKEVAELVFTPSGFSAFSSRFSYFSGSLSRQFPPENATVFLSDFFGTKTLKSFGIENDFLVQQTLALLFSYLQETQKMPMQHVSEISFEQDKKNLRLDYDTLVNLEIFANAGVLAMIDYTKTAMGKRLLRQWCLAPLREKSSIEQRLELVDALLCMPELKTALEKSFSAVSDIERIVGKFALRRASVHDAGRLSKSLQAIQALLPVLLTVPPENPWYSFAQDIINFFSEK